MKKILLIFIVLFSFNIHASAASICSYKEQTELNSKAANIKVSYEEKEIILHNEDMDTTKKVFEISIFNIIEDFYVIVKNNKNNSEMLFRGSDTTDGIAKFTWDDLSEVANFTFQVYTTEKTNCPDERFKTIYLTTPRYNIYYDREICSKLKEFYLCEKYVTFDEVDANEFSIKLKEYQEEISKIDNNKEEDNKTNDKDISLTDNIFKFLDTYKFIIIGGLLIVLAILYVVNRKKTKKQRDLGL